MKRHFLIVGLIFGLFTLIALPNQAQAQKKVGGDLIYGSRTGSMGLRVNGVYKISKQIRGAADFSFFFPSDNAGITTKGWALNFNGHYQFNVGARSHADLNVYGLAGLNLTSISREYSVGTNTNTEIGVNIGIGFEYPLNFADLYGEMTRSIISSNSQLVLSAGVRIPIGN